MKDQGKKDNNKKDHYVPVFYLKEFGNLFNKEKDIWKIWVYDKEQQKSFYSNIDETLSKNYFYKFLNEEKNSIFDSRLQDFESQFAPFIKKILNTINREVTILVCHHHEAYHCIIHDLYEFLIVANSIPPEQVLLLTNSPDITTEINYVGSIFNLGQIKAEWMLEFEKSASVTAKQLTHTNMQYAVAKTLIDKEYPKKFLSFKILSFWNECYHVQKLFLEIHFIKHKKL
jgi:hypothetical protein